MGKPYSGYGLVAEKGGDKFDSFRELTERLKKIYWERGEGKEIAEKKIAKAFRFVDIGPFGGIPGDPFGNNKLLFKIDVPPGKKMKDIRVKVSERAKNALPGKFYGEPVYEGNGVWNVNIMTRWTLSPFVNFTTLSENIFLEYELEDDKG